jgi:hypothetical protein
MVMATSGAASKMHAWNGKIVRSCTTPLETFRNVNITLRMRVRLSACDRDSIVITDDRIALLRMINEVIVDCREIRTIGRHFLNGRRISGLGGMQLS